MHYLTMEDSQRLYRWLTAKGSGKKLHLLDCLPAFLLRRESLPREPGRYAVDIVSQQEWEECFQVAGSLTLTLDLPEEVREITELHALPVVSAHTQAPEIRERFCFEGDYMDLCASEHDQTQWFVLAKPFDGYVYQQHNIHLSSMTHIATLLAGDSRAWYVPLAGNADSIKKRAYGKSLPSFGGYAPIMIEDLPTEDYYTLDSVLLLLALMRLYHDQDISLKLPDPNCLVKINDLDDETLSVGYFDSGISSLVYDNIPMIPSGRGREKIKTTIRRFFRLLEAIRKRISQFTQAQANVANIAFTNPQPSESINSLSHDTCIIEQNIYSLQRDMIECYLELTQWAAKTTTKEFLLAADRQHKAARKAPAKPLPSRVSEPSSWVKLYNGLYGLPAYFAAIPRGLDAGLEILPQEDGCSIVQIHRSPLHSDSTKNIYEPLQIVAPDTMALDHIQWLMGPNGARWLVPIGLIAFSCLYQRHQGYQDALTGYRVYLHEWLNTLRPDNIERFKAKGYANAFGQKISPRQAFNAVLAVLQGLRYTPRNGPGISSGYFQIIQRAETDKDSAYWVDIRLNPALYQDLSGQGQYYMLSHSKAMFSYKSKKLHYVPTAQWALEQLVGINKNRTPPGVTPPNQDGITCLRLAQRFGIMRGPHENMAHVIQRFETILNNLKAVGVVSDWRYQGERAEQEGFALQKKLLITMSDDYMSVYHGH